jgi:hypothetical protein
MPFPAVFRPGFVNDQETDAWFHVRVMEHLVPHFPFRLFVDPYGSIGDGQRVDTGPIFLTGWGRWWRFPSPGASTRFGRGTRRGGREKLDVLRYLPPSAGGGAGLAAAQLRMLYYPAPKAAVLAG